LRDHCNFETLHHAQIPAGDWRQWPSDLRDPRSPAVAAFADAHSLELLFHAFLQWLTDRSVGIAQVRARTGGMRIGLIGELAIGVDPAGSHAWSRQDDVLMAVTIGAPPDQNNPQGSRWGLTSFSPRALELNGFAPFIATLRAAMRRVGGVRLDHAAGLARLWLVPDGVEPSDGAWLSYPTVDLLRLMALESTRHNTVVIADDLGSAPPGFADLLEQVGVHETNVLWSQRARGGGFPPPRDWSRSAVAMTSSFDTPTVAGGWRGAESTTRGEHGVNQTDEAGREAQRSDLWQALVSEAVADGPAPPPDQPDAVVDAALRFVARTEAPLCLIPVDDFLARDDEQAGGACSTERRRLPLAADAFFRDESVKRRALAVARERPRQ
jgi:4-alpha-glucanotransferase